MKEKIKKILKNKIFLCVLTAFISTTIGVSAVTYFPSNDVTYDNTESGLQSTNVQGALDELYSQCKSSNESNNYLYYIVPNDGIYRMNLSDNSISRIGKYGINPTSIFVKDNYIYYSNNQGIYRMDIDGNNTVRLSTYTNAYHLYVTNQYIYFLEAYSNSYQYFRRMNLDGSANINLKELYGNYINSEIIVK